jgi:hypothetical protein
VSIRIKFGTLVRCTTVDKFKKVLDFAKKSRLNTSLMHSWRPATANFAPLGSVFQVTDFKEKKF